MVDNLLSHVPFLSVSTGEKPVILVLMHHCHEAKLATSRKTWDGNHILLHVDVFYHETKPGLLNCSQNEDAASAIGKELMKHFSCTFQENNQCSMNMDNTSPSPSHENQTNWYSSIFKRQ